MLLTRRQGAGPLFPKIRLIQQIGHNQMIDQFRILAKRPAEANGLRLIRRHQLQAHQASLLIIEAQFHHMPMLWTSSITMFTT